MDGKLVVHILLVIIIFLAILACRMYCRKRNKHKNLRLLIARINPMRVTPVLQPYPDYIQSRQSINAQINTNGNEHLPGSTCPSAEVSQPSAQSHPGSNSTDDQVSLESHNITEIDINTDDYIKSPPPPYSAVFRQNDVLGRLLSHFQGDLPTYEEAVRWSQEHSES